MFEPTYKRCILKRNSKAFELWEQWQKTKDPKDQAKLDKHMKELDTNEKLLMEKYPSV